MDSEVVYSPDLAKTVHVAEGIEGARALDPRRLLVDGNMLVIDGIDWRADFDPIRRALKPRQRKFEGRFNNGQPPPDAATEIDLLCEQARELFRSLFPGWRVKKSPTSWRNLRTGPEPMHFDTYDPKGCSLLHGFMNVDTTTREYLVSWRLSDLRRDEPGLLRYLWKACAHDPRNFSIEMRRRWCERESPFDGHIPAHQVDLAPKSIWFFDPKLILHQVIRGSGLVTVTFHVTNSGAPLQEDIIGGMI